MALYTEKNAKQLENMLSNYNGNEAYVLGQRYADQMGGNSYDYANSIRNYQKAEETAKANDNDNFLSSIGDFFVGKSAEREKADLADQYLKAYESNPYLFDSESYNSDIGNVKTDQDFKVGKAFNGGILGAIVNPWTQTGKAIGDFATSGTKAWEDGTRDITSDLGAAGQVALDVATLGLGTGANLGAKAGSTALKTMGKGAALGAGYGALGSMTEQGGNTWTGEGLGNLAASAGIGGALGGGLSGIGYGVNKYANKAQATRSLADAYKQAGYGNGGTKLLGDSSTKYSNANADFLNSRGNLAKTRVGQAIQGIGDQMAYNKINGRGISNSKVGNTVSKILSTNAGKIGAGVGGGLLLNKILNGNSGQTTNNSGMTDDELQELYNYYYGGY